MNLKKNLAENVSKMNRKTSAFIEENKLRTVNCGLEADLKELYRSLGEDVYSMWEKKVLDMEELTPLLMEIREKVGQVRANREQIRQIQKKGTLRPEAENAGTKDAGAKNAGAKGAGTGDEKPEAGQAERKQSEAAGQAEREQSEAAGQAKKEQAETAGQAPSESAGKTEEVGEWSDLERIYCPNCGISYAITANYCRKCGRKLH